jgi:cytosine/adenosine deaminase-related metal-dependent hydrolase
MGAKISEWRDFPVESVAQGAGSETLLILILTSLIMLLISADVIFTGNDAIRHGVISVDEEGIILDVLDPRTEYGRGFLSSHGQSVIEFYEGFICPGFVNAHCHMELSHLMGRLTEKKGLPHFVREVVSQRNATPEEISLAIERAEKEMIANGIVAVGDICNTSDTILTKQSSKLHYHNFVEVFDLDPSRAEEQFNNGIQLSNRFEETDSRVSIVPHAPYSVSLELLKRLSTCAYEKDSLLTIHNQETKSENQMFLEGTGEMAELIKNFGSPETKRWPTGFSSLASTLVHLMQCNRILLVHNTYTTNADIEWARQYSKQVWWCLCPNANLFIEDKLPDIDLLAREVSSHLLIGTDSNASNWSLSVLDEMKTISSRFEKITLEQMIAWATKNGAAFFGWKELGTIEKGKKPGLNLLIKVDANNLRLTEKTVVHPLLSA